MRPIDDTDDEIVIPIPLDRDSVRRLVRLARACGRHPHEEAAALLRDLLIEDEIANSDHPGPQHGGLH